MSLLFYFGLVGLILIFCILSNYVDYDFYARLIVGKSFLQTDSLFDYDFYSYGTTHKFIDHEWGSGVIFQLILDNFGEIGLFVFKSLCLFLTYFLIAKIIKLDNKDARLYILPFFFVIQSVAANVFTTIRCQTFSFLFFVLYLYILKFAKIKNNYKILWTIPLLNIIWTNLHGGFVMGIILLALFCLGEFLNKQKIKPYLITLLITIFTSLINPWNIEYFDFIFKALMLDRVHISEWQSAFFNKYYIFSFIKFKLFFFVSLLLFGANFAFNLRKNNFKLILKKLDKSKFLILVFVAIIALKSQRFHVFFSYSVLALCYSDFYRIFKYRLPKYLDNAKEIILIVLIIVSALSHIIEHGIISKTPSSMFPIKCVEFIQKNNIKGNVFTIFHTGSYVAYKLYPNNLVFMDGRYEEVYENTLIDEMGAFFLAKENYEFFLDKYKTDILIIDKLYPIYSRMMLNKNWQLVLEDDYFALFLKKDLIIKDFLLVPTDERYYQDAKFDTKIDWLN